MTFQLMSQAVIALMPIALALDTAVADQPLAPDARRKDEALAQVHEAIALTKELASRAFPELVDAVRRGQAAPGVEADPKLILPRFEAEWMRQLHPLLSAEVRLVRGAAQPTSEQLKPILADGRASLKQTASEFAKIQLVRDRTLLRTGERTVWPDARKLTVDALTQSAKRNLSAEQAQRYLRALENRAAARKRAAVMIVVANLDRDLFLSPEQRAKLIDVASSNWQEAWGRNIEQLHHGEYHPALPDEHVVPLLSEAQKQAWSSGRKNRQPWGGWIGLGFGFAHPGEDDEAAEDNGGSP